jgi:hypothetical protein
MLMVLSISLLNIFPLVVIAQSFDNETYPMALQRVPTKNSSVSASDNSTYPMANQRIPTTPES